MVEENTTQWLKKLNLLTESTSAFGAENLRCFAVAINDGFVSMRGVPN